MVALQELASSALIVPGGGVAVICGMLFLFQRRRSIRRGQREALKRPLPDLPRLGRGRNPKTTGDLYDVVFAGAVSLSLLDVIYRLAAIDPGVVNAMFDSHGDGSIHGINDLIARLDDHDSTQAWQGVVNRYKGYYGEHVVAAELEREGHEVEFPTNPNQQGYDLLVDGEKVQVKVGGDDEGIHEHLRENPEIPVITTREHAEEFAGDDRVFSLMNISGAEIEETTEETLNALREVPYMGEEFAAELPAELPVMTLVLAGGRNTLRWLDDEIDGATAIEHTALTTLGVTAGSWIGAEAGGILGSVGGPIGFAIGASIGAVAGALAGSSVAKDFKEFELNEARKRLSEALGLIPDRYCEAAQSAAAIAMERACAVRPSRRWRITPRFEDTLREELVQRFREIGKLYRDAEKSVQSRLLFIADKDDDLSEDERREQIAELGRDVLRNSPKVESADLTEAISVINERGEEVQAEMRKLGYAESDND